MIHLGRGWHLVRRPYRRRYADYLWLPGTTRARRIATRVREAVRTLKTWIPVGVQRLER